MSFVFILTAPFVQVVPNVPSACPPATAIVREIEEAVPPHLGEQVHLRLSFLEDESALRATFKASRRDWKQAVTRELQGIRSDCAALVSAVAFSTSLAVEELAALPPDPAASWSHSYHAGLHVASGPLPQPGLMAEFGVRLHHSWWRLGASGRAHFAQAGTVGEGRVRGRIVAGGLTLCAHWKSIYACGLGMGGWQHFMGRGFDVDHSNGAAFLSAGLRGEYIVPLSATWRLGVVAEVQRVLSPLQLTISGTPVWQSPTNIGALGLDVARTF